MERAARYLVRLENSRHLGVDEYRKVRSYYKDRLLTLGCTVNSTRISSVAVEIDFFSKNTGNAEEGLRELTSGGKVLSVTDLMKEEPPGAKEQVMEEARGLFNEERFWEVHEKVEGLWRRATGEEKLVQQSIILYSAALVHYQKNETETTLRMLGRSLEKMRWGEERYCSFDLSRMREEARKMIASGRVTIFRL